MAFVILKWTSVAGASDVAREWWDIADVEVLLESIGV